MQSANETKYSFNTKFITIEMPKGIDKQKSEIDF